MTTTISMRDFAYNAPRMYKVKTEGHARPVLAEGPPGIAKTALVIGLLVDRMRQVYKVPVGYVADILSHMDPMDMNGVLIPYKRADGTPAAAFTTSDLAVRIQQAEGYRDGIVIVNLDEFGGADTLMQKVVADLLSGHNLGNFHLPDNVWVVLTSNRQQDGAGVNKRLSHVSNRMTIYDVNLPVNDWLSGYAVPNNLPMVVRTFAEFVSGKFAQEVPRDGKPFMSFRSISAVAEAIAEENESRGDTNPMALNSKDTFLRASIEGMIGEAMAYELYGFALHAANLPTLAEIVADPMRARLPDAHELGAQYAAMGLLAASADPSNINQLWNYATRLCRDFQAVLLKNLSDKSFGGLLLNCPDVTRWLSDPANHALISNTWAAKR